MKKNLFYVLALAAMTSCSQDEVMEMAQQQAISFKEAFVENSVRSIDGTYSNSNKPTSFLVYGTTQDNVAGASIVPIFKGVTVGAVGEDYKYDAEYTQYWIPDNTYNFAAVVNGTVADADIVNGLPTKISYDATDQEDLLYATATATGLASNNPEVGFTFDHLLSKAMFTVNNTMLNIPANANYFYRVSNVKINNAYKAGTYYVEKSVENEAESWVPTTDENSTLVVSFGNICATTADTQDTAALKIGMQGQGTSNYHQVLIPAEYEALNITCTIETLIGDDVVNVENYTKDVAYTFVKGQAYNFVINLGNPGEPIQFTVTKVNEWDKDHDGKESTDGGDTDGDTQVDTNI